MSLRTRNTSSNSGLTIERTLVFLKKGWLLAEVVPRDSRFFQGFRLMHPENQDAPDLLVHNRAAESLIKNYGGSKLKTMSRRESDPVFIIRYYVWVDNPTASSDKPSQ
jgi:hypothetical protein